MLEFDHYEFRIAEHFLSALINCDYSGLDDAEQKQFDEWRNDACANVREGFTVGHWSDVEGSGEDWGRCDITGLFAMRCTVRLHIFKEA